MLFIFKPRYISLHYLIYCRIFGKSIIRSFSTLVHSVDGVQAGAALLPDGLPRRRPQEDYQVGHRDGPYNRFVGYPADGLGRIPYIQ